MKMGSNKILRFCFLGVITFIVVILNVKPLMAEQDYLYVTTAPKPAGYLYWYPTYSTPPESTFPSENIGWAGQSGTFYHSSETNTSLGGIYINYDGVYNFSGGSLFAQNLSLGSIEDTIGYFHQTGGVSTISNTLTIGQIGFIGSEYTLDAGELNFNSLVIGAGDLIQDGGTVTGNTEYINNGEYIQSGGLNTTTSLELGDGSSGTYTVEGSANLQVAGAIKLGKAGGGSGYLNIFGGTITADSVEIIDGGFNIENRSNIDIQSDLVDGGLFGGASTSGWEVASVRVDKGTTITNDGVFSVDTLTYGSPGSSPMTYDLGGTLNLGSYLSGWQGNGSELNITGTLNLASGAGVDADIMNVETSLNLNSSNILNANYLNTTADINLTSDSSMFVYNDFSMGDADININDNSYLFAYDTSMGNGTLNVLNGSTFDAFDGFDKGVGALNVLNSSMFNAYDGFDMAAGKLTVDDTDAEYDESGCYLWGEADFGDVDIDVLKESYVYVGELKYLTDASATGTINLDGQGFYSADWAWGTTSPATGDGYMGHADDTSVIINQTGENTEVDFDGTLSLAHGANSSVAYDITGGDLTTGDFIIADGLNTTATLNLSAPDPDDPDEYTLTVEGDMIIAGGTGSIGVVEQSNSSAKVEGTLRIGDGMNSSGTYRLDQGAKLVADKIYIGDVAVEPLPNPESGTLEINSDDVRITVTSELIFGRNASFYNTPITDAGRFPDKHNIYMKGDNESGAKLRVLGEYINPDASAISGLNDLSILFTGGTEINSCEMEAVGRDRGEYYADGGWVNNFVVDRLYIGSGGVDAVFTLTNHINNQEEAPEALYVNNFHMTYDSTLLNGMIVRDANESGGGHAVFDMGAYDLNIYWVRRWVWFWDDEDEDEGHWDEYEPDPVPVPEPLSIIMLGLALLGLAKKIRGRD